MKGSIIVGEMIRKKEKETEQYQLVDPPVAERV